MINFTFTVQIMGACINFKDCPAAMKYIEDFKSNSLHNSSLKTLREAYCGKSPTGRKVICERIPECYQRKFLTLWNRQLNRILATDKNYCVKSKDCCVASRLLDTKNVKVRKMLRQSRCDQESGEIKVKCGFLLETEGIPCINFTPTSHITNFFSRELSERNVVNHDRGRYVCYT